MDCIELCHLVASKEIPTTVIEEASDSRRRVGGWREEVRKLYLSFIFTVCYLCPFLVPILQEDKNNNYNDKVQVSYVEKLHKMCFQDDATSQ